MWFILFWSKRGREGERKSSHLLVTPQIPSPSRGGQGQNQESRTQLKSLNIITCLPACILARNWDQLNSQALQYIQGSILTFMLNALHSLPLVMRQPILYGLDLIVMISSHLNYLLKVPSSTLGVQVTNISNIPLNCGRHEEAKKLQNSSLIRHYWCLKRTLAFCYLLSVSPHY